MKVIKNHNSILFLTTLGVYLGLVLVGGAVPQAFAHSATAKHFELTDEIEIEDDLDKNPDAEASTLNESLGVYLQDVEFFLTGLRRLRVSGRFDAFRETFEVAQSTVLPCVPANKTGSYSAEKFATENEWLRPSLELFSKRLTDGYSLADCLPNDRLTGLEATSSKFAVTLDKSSFSVEVRVKKTSRIEAQRLLSELKQTYKLFVPTTSNSVRSRIYENTTFRAENDQVFIVTRLPRAGLSRLLNDAS
ncbi:MAG: hypothetical protein ABI539_05970 [Acidobacteriota bacterium]